MILVNPKLTEVVKRLHRWLARLTQIALMLFGASGLVIKWRQASYGLAEPLTIDLLLTAIALISAVWVIGIACFLLIRFMVDEEL